MLVMSACHAQLCLRVPGSNKYQVVINTHFYILFLKSIELCPILHPFSYLRALVIYVLPFHVLSPVTSLSCMSYTALDKLSLHVCIPQVSRHDFSRRCRCVAVLWRRSIPHQRKSEAAWLLYAGLKVVTVMCVANSLAPASLCFCGCDPKKKKKKISCCFKAGYTTQCSCGAICPSLCCKIQLQEKVYEDQVGQRVLGQVHSSVCIQEVILAEIQTPELTGRKGNEGQRERLRAHGSM